ncbi:hypothetical protein SB765_34115, partial [Pseudomonas sp. SIMBA_067]
DGRGRVHRQRGAIGHIDPAGERTDGRRAIAEPQSASPDRRIATVAIAATKHLHAGAGLDHRARARNIARV